MVEFSIPLVVGVFIVIVISFDFFYTTLSFNGAGFINRYSTAALSSFFLLLNKHTSSRNIFKYSGLSHLLLSVLLWVVLLWIGLFLILSSDSNSIVHSTSKEPANLVNTFYFSGYVLSTLGNGEFVPNSKTWQIVVAVFSFSGFIYLTTGISYLLNVGSAILHKRSLAAFISNLGESPEEVVANTYSEGNFDVLTERISQLQEKINTHHQNHYAYPISHYFYSVSRKESLAINLSNLNEAIITIEHFVDTDTTPIEREIAILKDAIHKFLSTLENNFITKYEDFEDLSPDFEKLKISGIPIVDPSTVENDETFAEDKRALFAGFLKSSGWTWEDVYRKNSD